MEHEAIERVYLLSIARKHIAIGAVVGLLGIVNVAASLYLAGAVSWAGWMAAAGGASVLLRGLRERSRALRVPSNLL